LPYNSELVEKFAEMIRASHPGVVRTAYLNIDKPNIPEGLESFAGTGVNKVVALPIFLAHGVHTQEDIPRELGIKKDGKGSFKLDGVDVEILCAEPLGVDECIANLAYRRVMEAVR
jgi:sirohydrochlorin cobaltochelatase